MSRIRVTQVSPGEILIPEGFNRDRVDVVADSILRRSIEQSGIQQPLVLLAFGDIYMLIDGLRRLIMARELGIPKVPVAIDTVPNGEDPTRYASRLRFILDEHRQDLLPSQKGALIAELKRSHKFSNADLAKFLGVDADSITNWLAVLKYIPAVLDAMDVGRLTMAAARVFDGMTDEGQKEVWRRHQADLFAKEDRAGIHKRLRALYPPEKCPTYYRSAKAIAQRLQASGSAKRRRDTAEDLSGFLASKEAKEAELAELQLELTATRAEIKAATPIVSALLRNPDLRALVPEEMLPELERFAEVYG